MENDKKKRQAVENGDSLSSNKKRQIYIWDENMEFFNSLRNKSKLINLLIRKYKEEHGESTT